MEMQQPGVVHQQLARLAGTWRGAETMHPSPWAPEGFEAQSRWTARMALNGFYLLAEYAQIVGGQVTFEGHGVYGFDPRQERYTMHWFDSMGADPGAPALGTLDGDRLEFRNVTPMGHGRFTYTLEGPDRFRFLMEHSADGERFTTLMEGTYTRV